MLTFWKHHRAKKELVHHRILKCEIHLAHDLKLKDKTDTNPSSYFLLQHAPRKGSMNPILSMGKLRPRVNWRFI